MAISYTPRLQLAKPDADEFQLIGVIDTNFDLLDKGVGARMVTAGIIPPVNEMYDGMIVNERDTGKTWIASTNPAGGFDRAWIRFPWSINTLSLGYSLANGASGSPALTLIAGGVNSGPGDIVGGNIVIPISGIYRFDINALYGPNDNSGVNWRTVGVEVNGVTNVNTSTYVPYNQPNTNQRFQFSSMPLLLAAGAKIAARQYQNSGLTMPGCSCGVVATLISVTGKNNN